VLSSGEVSRGAAQQDSSRGPREYLALCPARRRRYALQCRCQPSAMARRCARLSSQLASAVAREGHAHATSVQSPNSDAFSEYALQDGAQRVPVDVHLWLVGFQGQGPIRVHGTQHADERVVGREGLMELAFEALGLLVSHRRPRHGRR
jgi:hypothetical protein